MPLTMRPEQNLFVPIIVCDHCAEEIRSAAAACYQWLLSGGLVRIYFTHKACCQAFRKRHGGRWGAVELSCLPVYLVNNLGIDWDEAQEMAGLYARF